MSRYMIAIVSENISMQQINEVGSKYDLIFTPIKNKFLDRQLSDNDMLYYLVEWVNSKYNIVIEETEESNEYYKNLWGTLFCAFGNLNENLSKDFARCIKRQAAERDNTVTLYKKNMIQFLMDFFSENSDNKIGLLLHWYNGIIESENVVIKAIREVVIKPLEMCQSINSMDEDVLYMYTYQAD